MSDPAHPTPPPSRSRYALWAILLMVLGWLIAITTGLCGGAFIISGMSESSSIGEAIIMSGLILGGIPCLGGVGMILAARKWGRRKPTAADPNVFT
jgi:hypothetical protein